MIGNLGDVTFEVSSESVKTFRDLSFTRAARYATHEIHGKKGLLEFTGLTPATASLKVRLDTSLGVDPMSELTTLRDMLANHEAAAFVLNGEVQGDGLWVLENLGESHDVIDNLGRPRVVEVTLSLKEYVEAAP